MYKLFFILLFPLNLIAENADNSMIKTRLNHANFQNLDAASFDFESLVAKRDATFVVDQKGLFGFFSTALKAVAVWAGAKLTKWVLSKIRRRAGTYSERYYTDPGVQRAAAHWEDMIQRSGTNSCHVGPEPDHDPWTPGFQKTEDCPICEKSASDLKSL